MRLILASGSPRRAALLRAAGFEFETIVTDVDERIRPGEDASSYVRRLAAEKSAAAVVDASAGRSAEGHPTAHSPRGGDPVASRSSRSNGARAFKRTDRGHDVVFLAADTAVVIDGEILGKPRDDDEAGDMLRRLSGRRHDVLTGVSLRRDALEIGRVETTAVYFATLTPDEVAWYVASGEGRDKAGGYAIQGLASRFVSRIDGSYSNVVGLPVATVVELLQQIAGNPAH